MVVRQDRSNVTKKKIKKMGRTQTDRQTDRHLKVLIRKQEKHFRVEQCSMKVLREPQTLLVHEK